MHIWMSSYALLYEVVGLDMMNIVYVYITCSLFIVELLVLLDTIHATILNIVA